MKFKLSKLTLLFPLTAIATTAATVTSLFDSTTTNPIAGGKFNLGWVRSSAIIDGDILFGYGQPANGVYKWNKGDPQVYTLGGAFSDFSESEGSLYSAVNYNSGTHRITRTDQQGTEIILEDAASLGKSTGLASTHFPRTANGKTVFNIQQGPTSGVDYAAIIYYDGTDFTYVAETGQSIPGNSSQFGVLTGFDTAISDDGSRIAFLYDANNSFTQSVFEWDGSTLSQLLDSSSYFPKNILYIGNTLYFSGNDNAGGTGLYRIDAASSATQLINGNNPISGSVYSFASEQVIASNGKIG